MSGILGNSRKGRSGPGKNGYVPNINGAADNGTLTALDHRVNLRAQAFQFSVERRSRAAAAGLLVALLLILRHGCDGISNPTFRGRQFTLPSANEIGAQAGNGFVIWRFNCSALARRFWMRRCVAPSDGRSRLIASSTSLSARRKPSNSALSQADSVRCGPTPKRNEPG